MSRFESVVHWFCQKKRREDPAMRRISMLGQGPDIASGVAIPLFFARKSFPSLKERRLRSPFCQF